jgi:hypothetical protein
MRCDECKYWVESNYENDVGSCKQLGHILGIYREEPETESDFFCAAFEGKDDE